MFELAYGCGLRAEELVNLDLESIEFAAEQIRVRRQSGQDPCVPAGEPALRSVARYLERGRPGLAGADAESALLLSKSGRRLSTSDVRRRLRVWARHADAAPVCGRSGSARPRIHVHDPGLHSDRVIAPKGRVRQKPSASLGTGRTSWKPT